LLGVNETGGLSEILINSKWGAGEKDYLPCVSCRSTVTAKAVSFLFFIGSRKACQEFNIAISGEKYMNMVLLCILWIIWCAMHSILIDVSVIKAIKNYAPVLTRCYRLVYNGLSLVTLIPLIIITRMTGGPMIVSWDGYTILVRLLLLVTALLLFRAGARKYDLQHFLGIKQFQTGEEHLLLSDTEEFTEAGVFGITRHPWYFGSLLFIWSMLGQYPLPVFLAVCILSIYLVIGTVLEERKIVARYGESYQRYRQRVSMLFPWKWLARVVLCRCRSCEKKVG